MRYGILVPVPLCQRVLVGARHHRDLNPGRLEGTEAAPSQGGFLPADRGRRLQRRIDVRRRVIQADGLDGFGGNEVPGLTVSDEVGKEGGFGCGAVAAEATAVAEISILAAGEEDIG